MDWLRESVHKTLPTLTDEDVTKVVAKLEEKGVDDPELLQEIEVEDFEGVIPVIKCRKLVKTWKAPKGIYFYRKS